MEIEETKLEEAFTANAGHRFPGRWQVESAVVLQQHTFDNSFGRDYVPAEQVTAIERLPPIPA